MVLSFLNQDVLVLQRDFQRSMKEEQVVSLLRNWLHFHEGELNGNLLLHQDLYRKSIYLFLYFEKKKYLEEMTSSQMEHKLWK